MFSRSWFSRSCSALFLALAAALAAQAIPHPQAGTPPAIPDTPAGRTFKAWLEAFNSGDRAQLEAYLHKYDPSKPVDNKASKVRIVLGHVAPMPRVAEEAAKALEGKEVTEETAAAAGKAAAEGAKPLSQNAYKVKLVEVAVKRAALTAAGQKRYWEA